MRGIFYIITLLFAEAFCFAQCPSDGDVFLSSQEQVDEFVANYAGCNTISGDLKIASALTGQGDTGATGTNITDLSQLNFIEVIKGELTITAEMLEISNFNNLKQVYENIEITNSPLLQKIEGFNNLERVHSIFIALNNNLQTISGFNKIESTGGSVEIGFNPKITSILGFNNLKNIGTELNISENPELISFSQMNQLETIGDDLNFTSDQKLLITDAFNSLQRIGNDFNLESIKGITGFNSLKSIERFFDIEGQEVEEIAHFNQLEFIGGGFRIKDTQITKIEGFNLLNKVGHIYFLEDWFILTNNTSLHQVIGFGSFTLVDGFFEVMNNTSMSDCTWMCYLFNNGTITGDVTIQNNLGNCSSAAIIIEICDPDFDNDGVANVVDLDDDNDGIRDTLEGNGNIDTDNDGFPDSKDLDSDKDNCFDVLESGFSDPNNDGTLGDLPDEVDFNGLIINESTGYTTPDDLDNNSIFDFQESSTLDPGENTIFQICLNDAPTDLFSVLGGTPDAGGTWSPSLSGGNGIFDPRVDAAGVYTYTHFNAICGDVNAEVKVEFPSDLNSGFDTEVIVCNQTGLVDLFDALEGNPTPGGTWTPELASGSGVFNPFADAPGNYTYTLRNRECGVVSSTVEVTFLNTPNAGIGRKIAICEFEGSINLVEKLAGTPDSEGVWSPSLASGNNTFNPSIDTSGVYTYTIDNGRCGFSSANLEIEVVQDSEISNTFIKINDFSNTSNSVTIGVNSSRTYEYSLDGINYQPQNTFENLEGGIQKIYARGTNGCEYFEKEIFIRTFPKFFTPNYDGINDVWRLKHFPNVNYIIYIYDRYGRLVKKLKNQNDFWDGKLNGKNAPTSNYWFKVVLETGEVLNGNFSLLRK